MIKLIVLVACSICINVSPKTLSHLLYLYIARSFEITALRATRANDDRIVSSKSSEKLTLITCIYN